MSDIRDGLFIWDADKERTNLLKHGVDFKTACLAFEDEKRVFVVDPEHSGAENRMFCLGKARGRVLTVRFVYRGELVRIIGAGYWRKGAKEYEKKARS